MSILHGSRPGPLSNTYSLPPLYSKCKRLRSDNINLLLNITEFREFDVIQIWFVPDEIQWDFIPRVLKGSGNFRCLGS